MGFIKTAGIGIGGLILLGACFGGDGDEAAPTKDSPAAVEKTDKVVDEVSDDVVEEVVAEPEPTQEDVWRQNYDDNGKRIQKAVTRRLPAYKQPLGSANDALASCAEIADGKPLAKRVKSAAARWSSDPTQTIVLLTVVAENVCPDVSETHVKQVTEKRKADAAAARRKAAAARRAAERRALLAQQQAAAQQQAQTVYFANCSDVEAAGAAPIYAGDPGYSRDLDRDGDGVACEQ